MLRFRDGERDCNRLVTFVSEALPVGSDDHASDDQDFSCCVSEQIKGWSVIGLSAVRMMAGCTVGGSQNDGGWQSCWELEYWQVIELLKVRMLASSKVVENQNVGRYQSCWKLECQQGVQLEVRILAGSRVVLSCCDLPGVSPAQLSVIAVCCFYEAFQCSCLPLYARLPTRKEANKEKKKTVQYIRETELQIQTTPNHVEIFR